MECCNHIQTGASVHHPDAEFICRRLKGHTGNHGNWHRVSDAPVAEQAPREAFICY